MNSIFGLKLSIQLSSESFIFLFRATKPTHFCFLPPTCRYLPKTMSTLLDESAQSEGYFGTSKCSSLIMHGYNQKDDKPKHQQ